MNRSFTTRLERYPGKGGWTFAPIPKKHALPITRPWGHTPVRASVCVLIPCAVQTLWKLTAP